MKYLRITSGLIFLFCVIGVNAIAQEAVLAAGGDAAGSGGSSSYSVGQILYTTDSSGDGSIAKGVQQPFEISTIVGVKLTRIHLDLIVYPNPTTDILTLKIDEVSLSTLSFQLYDLHGKMLKSEKIKGDRTRITMKNLPPATYFLKVLNEQEEVKVFKIIKN